MARLTVPLISLAAIVLATAVGFIGLSDRVYPFTESLQREDSLNEEVHETRSSASLRFRHDDEDVTLAAEVMITALDNGMYELALHTSHTNGVDTHLDSLSATLNLGQSMPEVALRTPGGMPWEPVHFQRTTDGQGVMIDVPDLGVQGSGTVSLEFLIGPYQSADDVPDSIWLDYNAQLHPESGLQLTDYAADALVEVPMPAGERDTTD